MISLWISIASAIDLLDPAIVMCVATGVSAASCALAIAAIRVAKDRKVRQPPASDGDDGESKT